MRKTARGVDFDGVLGRSACPLMADARQHHALVCLRPVRERQGYGSVRGCGVDINSLPKKSDRGGQFIDVIAVCSIEAAKVQVVGLIVLEPLPGLWTIGTNSQLQRSSNVDRNLILHLQYITRWSVIRLRP